KIGDNLRAAVPRLPLSRQLVTIRTDVPLELLPTDLILRERDVDRLRELYTRYGFNSALKELESAATANVAAVAATGITESAPARPPPPAASEAAKAAAPIGARGEYEIVTDEARLADWIERLR